MVTPHFQGTFGQARDFFDGNLQKFIETNCFILVNHRVSGGVLFQMPFFKHRHSIWR